MNSNASVSAASVYRLKDRLIVSPDKRTTAGLVVASEPFVVLPLEATNDDLGSTLMKALALSKTPMSHPVDWKAIAASRLAAAGVKSKRTFQLNATLVQVTRNDQYYVGPSGKYVACEVLAPRSRASSPPRCASFDSMETNPAGFGWVVASFALLKFRDGRHIPPMGKNSYPCLIQSNLRNFSLDGSERRVPQSRTVQELRANV